MKITVQGMGPFEYDPETQQWKTGEYLPEAVKLLNRISRQAVDEAHPSQGFPVAIGFYAPSQELDEVVVDDTGITDHIPPVIEGRVY